DVLNELCQLPHWEDAFIKEWYAFSPSFVTSKKEVVEASANPTMLIHIFSPEVEDQSLEMVFQSVEYISVFFNTDFEPHGRFQHDRIFFSFSGVEDDIQAKFLYYRILEQNEWGQKFRYGSKDFLEKNGPKIFEEWDIITQDY